MNYTLMVFILLLLIVSFKLDNDKENSTALTVAMVVAVFGIICSL